jgi:hypothetical protein
MPMKPYQDPNDPRNGAAYHTGKRCVEHGCENPAGTAWSPHWCHLCNVQRIDRINAQFSALAEKLGISFAEGSPNEDH